MNQLGCFYHNETNVQFAYYANTDHSWSDLPHIIPMRDGSVRFARILKTVAHVVVDENEHGGPVIERWPLKRHYEFHAS
jgi:hypothetical protein